ncbi:hypothetical protein [Paenibacillus sp. RC67]|nr:hypothetical protein [Paenibacillus sp. RC67]
MNIVLDIVAENGLGTLERLCELGAYDLSEFNGANMNENGLYIKHFNATS